MVANENKANVTSTEVIAMFRGLNIPVTDDSNLIETKGNELEPMYRRRKQSPDGQQRAEADKWYKNLSRLQNRRGELLDVMRKEFIQLAHTALAAALGAGINKLTRELFDRLNDIAVSRCNCDAALAADFVKSYLKENNISISKNLVSPQLVEHLEAKAEVDKVKLSWILPETDCDEIILKRFDKTPGGFSSKGRRLCRGRMTGFSDHTVEPGRRYRYEVFSVFKDVESSTGIPVEVTAVGEVSGLHCVWENNHVAIKWKKPFPGCSVYIFRSSEPIKPVSGGAPDPLPQSKNIDIVTRQSESIWRDREAEPGIRYYYLAVAWFAPGAYSAGVPVSIHTPVAPPTPPSAEAWFRNNEVHVQWEKARAAKPLEYIVVRTEGSTVPEEPGQGVRIVKTKQNRCVDKSAETGKRYTYTVFSHLNNIVSRTGAVSGAVETLADIKRVDVVGGDGFVDLHWTLPDNAENIIIRRGLSELSGPEEGEPVPVTGSGSAKDSGLENGSTYHYYISCQYRSIDQTPLYSPGVRIRAVPERLPEPAGHFLVKSLEREIKCTWTAPAHGTTVVMRFAKPHELEFGTRLTVEEMEALGGERMRSGSFEASDNEPDIDAPYYSIFTVAGSHAVAGGQGCGAVYPDVGDLRAVVVMDGVILRWSWPRHCNAVKVVCRSDRFPSGPNDRSARKFTVTRPQYNTNGNKFKDRFHVAGSFYYIVYARVPGIDGMFFSSGNGSACRTEVSWRPWMTLTYCVFTLCERGRRGRQLGISWTVEDAFPDFAGFVMVASPERPPFSDKDGETLFCWKPPHGRTGGRWSGCIDLEPVQRRGWAFFYCKLFPVDPGQADAVLVIHPNTCLPITSGGEIRYRTPGDGANRKHSNVPREAVCPACFERFPVEKIVYDSAFGGEEQQVRGNWFGKFSRRPPRAPRDKNGKTLERKLCPECKQDLPFTTGLQESLVIGIIGARFSGKSHYIASLIQRLSGITGADFHASLIPVTDGSADRYEAEFLEPLFNRNSEIPVTHGSPPPLIYDLTLSGTLLGEKKNRSVTLSFYDTAGENLGNPNAVRQMVRYLREAGGVIFLIDPLQIPEVQAELPYFGILPDAGEMAGPNAIIGNVLKELENNGVLNFNAPLETPVAVALSKCDVLRDNGLIEPNRIWNTDMRHVGYYNGPVHDDMNGMWSEYVRRWSIDTYSTVTTRFRKYAFFGVSATGCASDPDKRVFPFISPWRVEEPLLWLLAELGVIPVKNGER